MEDVMDKCGTCNRPICYGCPYQEEPQQLCPMCKSVYINMDEDMCEDCLVLLGLEKRNKNK